MDALNSILILYKNELANANELKLIYQAQLEEHKQRIKQLEQQINELQQQIPRVVE